MTAPVDGSPPTGDGPVVRREVTTVRTREPIAGEPSEAMAPTQSTSRARTGRYFESLPELMTAVGLVVLTAIDALLATRFLLLAFGANPGSGVVGFIDDLSWPLVRPFANIFNNRSWDQGVIEISTIVGMGVYVLIFAFLGMLLTAFDPRLSRQDHGLDGCAHAAATALAGSCTMAPRVSA